jgi:dipeptidyl aminopeptidase/acylaminoacyl peptidase
MALFFLQSFFFQPRSTVSVEESRRLVAALRAAGHEVRYTEFPDLGHESWDRAYAMRELRAWAAEQRLTRPSKER